MSKNTQANRLAKLATSQLENLDPHVHIETIDAHSIEEPKLALLTELEPSWIDLILDYLITGALSEDRSAIRKVTHQAPHYILYDRKLYKRSFTLPL